MKMWPTLLLLLAATSAWAAPHTVIVGGVTSGYYGDQASLMFNPSNLTIAVGDTVTFTNAGGPPHNVHADDGSFRCAEGCDGAGGNGTPSSGNWSSTVTFNHPGTIAYHCDNHGSMGMNGTITVQGVASGNVPITNGFTGSWVDGGSTGQSGFALEVQTNGSIVAEWYTYGPQGGQSWIGGVGPIVNGDHAVIPAYQIDGPGGRFPPNFAASGVQATSWGTMTFTFTDCDHGLLAWTSTIPGYGNGSMPIVRLTHPAGLTCQ
jgi:plastocyanin